MRVVNNITPILQQSCLIIIRILQEKLISEIPLIYKRDEVKYEYR